MLGIVATAFGITIPTWYILSGRSTSKPEEGRPVPALQRGQVYHCTLDSYKDSSITTAEVTKLMSSEKFIQWHRDVYLPRLREEAKPRLHVRFLLLVVCLIATCLLPAVHVDRHTLLQFALQGVSDAAGNHFYWGLGATAAALAVNLFVVFPNPGAASVALASAIALLMLTGTVAWGYGTVLVLLVTTTNAFLIVNE